jgi:hypothetical protein
MKNIQVVDGAVNCVYDIFQASDEDVAQIFGNKSDRDIVKCCGSAV